MYAEKKEKAYICLLLVLCLQVISDMTESSIIQAFQSQKISFKDYDKITYQATANTTHQLMNSTTVKDPLHNHGTEWRCIPKRV
jgi:hypothetical protein